MSENFDIGSLISRDPNIRGGLPCVAGTGVTVHRIIGWYKLGLSPEEIAETIGHISLAQVHAAIAYYHSDREEIESYILEENKKGNEVEEKHFHSGKLSK